MAKILELLLLSSFGEWLIVFMNSMRLRQLQAMCVIGDEKPTLLHVVGLKKVDWPEGKGL